MQNNWSPFSYIVTNLARFIRPNEITFSGVNSTMPMLACLMAKKPMSGISFTSTWLAAWTRRLR